MTLPASFTSTIPMEFVFFALTLLGVALFHKHALGVSLVGLAVIAAYKIRYAAFKTGLGLAGFISHLGHEWVILVNLLCLLTGFALLSHHFEKSHVPAVLPRYLPSDWKGGFVLLAVVWVLSSFLDNIAGALVGAGLARQVYHGKVHIGFLVAIVAASNAGGAWSVLGDTTTTMMWIAGISPARVFKAIVGATVALFIFGVPAAFQQHRYSPMLRTTDEHPPVDWIRVGIVAFILTLALATNVTINLKFTEMADEFPFLGVAAWVALLLSLGLRRPDWHLLPDVLKGSIFLLALVLCASMMPVEELPPASWQTALGLGFLSAGFDNIPLTALALKQGGYDWGFLAYTVGFGGSIIWFGSSSGVALSNMYPETRSVRQWLRHGWYVPLAYVVGFYVMLVAWPWHPDEQLAEPAPAHTASETTART